MTDEVKAGLIGEAEKALNYLKNCKRIEVHRTGVPWPHDLEYFLLLAKGEPVPGLVQRDYEHRKRWEESTLKKIV